LWTMTVFETTGPSRTLEPEFASVALTVVVQLTSPTEEPLYVQTKVCEAPPARSNGCAGTGPATYETPPGPVSMNGAASTPSAAAWPVFVTVTATATFWPVEMYRGSATVRATSAARVCTVRLTGSQPFTAVPAHVVPAAVAENVTAPAPEAEYVHVNVCDAPPAI